MRLPICFIIALAGVSVSFAAPGAHAAEDPVVTHQVTTDAEADARVRAYWTPERIQGLDPGGVPTDPRTPTGSTGAEWVDGGLVSSTVGRLLFSKGNVDESCTGTVVSSANQAVVLTAAHCVRDSDLDPTRPRAGEWTSNLLFVPGFRDGAAPRGGFTVREVYVSRDWANPGKGFLNHDIAFLVVNRDAGGRSLVTAAGGAQRVSFNAQSPRRLHQFGFPRYSVDGTHPDAAAFRGQRLAFCRGETQIITDPVYQTRRSEGVPCTMGSGASGGPHFVDFDASRGAGTVVGVNSFLSSGERDRDSIYLMGPPLTTVAKALYERAQQSGL